MQQIIKSKINIFFISILMVICISCSSNHSSKIDKNKIDYKLASKLNVELGLGYLEQGQVSRAKKKLVHALELDRKNIEAHSALGYFFEYVGDYKEAEKKYKSAIKLSVNNSENLGSAYNNYGTFLCRQKQYKEADKYFNLSLQDKGYSNTAEVYENAGTCAFSNNDLNKAKYYFETAKVRDPNRYSAVLSLSKIAYKESNYKLAKNYLTLFEQNTDHTAESVMLGINIAKKQSDFNSENQYSIELKNIFPNSKEYNNYKNNSYTEERE